MEAIINQKKYNTETATEIEYYNNNLGPTDFRFIDETLYRTEKGNWFLDGSGGAMTGYSRAVGDARTDGRDIIPLSEGEAYDWLEKHNKVDAIDEFFPDMIEDA